MRPHRRQRPCHVAQLSYCVNRCTRREAKRCVAFVEGNGTEGAGWVCPLELQRQGFHLLKFRYDFDKREKERKRETEIL
ncbi:hypothetical protein Ahy_B05g078677 isoform B [Arachis hypogaea]|uniref:Uncharacterized protein n=1 Tax=Arachis hypogaea TaxID=3818 RepID=A0A444Z7P2_ARAHY|nr:hypothetical protein Ahy_B05g078677 isoform B [Arachis hypogaea]